MSEGFIDRLKELCKNLRLEDQKIAKSGGITKETFSSYKAGRSLPRFSVIQSWCKNFGVNANWLILGEGPMYRKDMAQESFDHELDTSDPIAQRVQVVEAAMRRAGASETEIKAAVMEALRAGKVSYGVAEERLAPHGLQEHPGEFGPGSTAAPVAAVQDAGAATKE